MKMRGQGRCGTAIAGNALLRATNGPWGCLLRTYPAKADASLTSRLAQSIQDCRPGLSPLRESRDVMAIDGAGRPL